jgi:hypothetical protein
LQETTGEDVENPIKKQKKEKKGKDQTGFDPSRIYSIEELVQFGFSLFLSLNIKRLSARKDMWMIQIYIQLP